MHTEGRYCKFRGMPLKVRVRYETRNKYHGQPEKLMNRSCEKFQRKRR